MKTLAEYLDLAEVAHGHLCAGQVLGVRELGIDDPIAERKRLVTYVEIDRCVTDAVALVANCRLGKRALKFRDWGKVAATFVDLKNGRAVRIAARESTSSVKSSSTGAPFAAPALANAITSACSACLSGGIPFPSY